MSTDDFDIGLFGRNSIPDCKPPARIQEFKLVQSLLKYIKFVQSFNEDILREQSKVWLSFKCNITDESQQQRISSTLQNHCLIPITWISPYELELNINPGCKIIKPAKG